MKIAVLDRNWPKSFEIYIKNICYQLSASGVEFEPFENADEIPRNCDLIWTQNDPIIDSYKVIRRSRVPIVTTIHGVNQFILPLKFWATSKKEHLRWRFKKPIQKCFWKIASKHVSAFIAVSSYCKSCVQHVYRIPSRSIRVIYHGYNPSIFNENVLPFESKYPYFLHVSNGAPVKNIESIVKAFESLDEKEVNLIIVAPFYKGKINNPRIKFISQNQFVSQEMIAKLYRGAICFVFPSFDETFGLPILEAMSCGCPVITSHVSACPEVAGDAALLIDPYQVKQIAEAMHNMLNISNSREVFANKLSAQCKKFSWTKSAAEHYKVFQNVLNNPNFYK